MFDDTMKQSKVEHLHGFQDEPAEKGAHVLPEGSLAAKFFQDGLEQGTAQLLSLVDEEASIITFTKTMLRYFWPSP